MEQFKINSATVRIHNQPNQETLKTATEQFLKKVRRQKKKQNGGKRNDNA